MRLDPHIFDYDTIQFLCGRHLKFKDGRHICPAFSHVSSAGVKNYTSEEGGTEEFGMKESFRGSW